MDRELPEDEKDGQFLDQKDIGGETGLVEGGDCAGLGVGHEEIGETEDDGRRGGCQECSIVL